MAVKRLDLGRTWADVVAMARKNAEVVSAVAGMFILMPGLLSAWFLPRRAVPTAKSTMTDILTANADYIATNWPLIIASAVIVALGSMVLLSFLLENDRPTVSEALRRGVRVLPPYMLASVIQSLVVAGGILFLVVPGLYLLSRFICIAPVAVAEGERRPLAIIGRSFQLTRGNGWRIILLLAVILLVAIIISTVLSTIFGIIGMLLLPADIALFINIFVGSLIQTVLATCITLVSAAIYRQTTA